MAFIGGDYDIERLLTRRKKVVFLNFISLTLMDLWMGVKIVLDIS